MYEWSISTHFCKPVNLIMWVLFAEWPLVPTVICDLGHISWTGSKDLQTTMYQGQTVVIDDKVYYGGNDTNYKHLECFVC